MGLPLMVLGAVWVPKGDGGAFLLSRAHRDSSRWQRHCRAHPSPTLAALNVSAQGAKCAPVSSPGPPLSVERAPGGGVPFSRLLRGRSRVAGSPEQQRAILVRR